MRCNDPPEVWVGGPLAHWAEGFIAYLTSRGYVWSSASHHLYLMAELSTWLGRQGLAAVDLTPLVAERFWEFLRADSSYHTKSASMEPLLAYLRGLGVLPEQQDDEPADATDVLLRDYERYLRVERRLREKTISAYRAIAANFLKAVNETAPADQSGRREITEYLPTLDGARVLEAVSRQITDFRLPSLGSVMTGDRAVLRFLERTGRVTGPLADAVPRAALPPSRLPKQTDPETVETILGGCDRTTEVGRRDYAVMLLFHRYGLRPIEVSRLQLPDIRWREGEFTVRGKAGRVDVLPLVRDVGEAIVDYLQVRRAAPPEVSAVFLSARAPLQPMGRDAVRGVVRRACGRGSVAPIGPRAFRHGVGHDLLAAGASLVEIRDVLRHRNVETTARYTRADVSALRPLARPWPGASNHRSSVAEVTS
jgi:integrase/recombinase XerD